jgi:hypothetical protein
MRKLLVLAVLIVGAAALLLLTQPGQRVLRIFGVSMTECTQAHWLNALGYHVPECTCGSCSSPPLPERPGTR